jgi:hypothetical protein
LATRTGCTLPRMKLYASFVILAACGSSGNKANPDVGQPDAKPIDARVFLDAPPVVPPMITLSGTATDDGQSGSSPLANVAIALYKTSDETTAIGSATSAADGTYSFMVATDGLVVDAFIKATLSGYVDNYVYPAAAFKADTSTDLNLVNTTDFGLLGVITGQSSSNGFVVVEITDAGGNAITGATVQSDPASGTYRYTDTSSGTPTAKISTANDGAGFCINVPPGNVTVSAAKAGASFKSHVINAHANAFTNTTVTE